MAKQYTSGAKSKHVLVKKLLAQGQTTVLVWREGALSRSSVGWRFSSDQFPAGRKLGYDIEMSERCIASMAK